MGASQMEDQAGGGERVVLIAIVVLKPITAIRDPPTGKGDRNGCGQRPPEGKHDVREHAKNGEYDPKDFAFHRIILFRLRHLSG
jgi:hypothetical protein